MTDFFPTYGVEGRVYAIYPAGTGPITGFLDGRPYRAVLRGSRADDRSGLIGYARGRTAKGAMAVFSRAAGGYLSGDTGAEDDGDPGDIKLATGLYLSVGP